MRHSVENGSEGLATKGPVRVIDVDAVLVYRMRVCTDGDESADVVARRRNATVLDMVPLFWRAAARVR